MTDYQAYANLYGYELANCVDHYKKGCRWFVDHWVIGSDMEEFR